MMHSQRAYCHIGGTKTFLFSMNIRKFVLSYIFWIKKRPHLTYMRKTHVQKHFMHVQIMDTSEYVTESCHIGDLKRLPAYLTKKYTYGTKIWPHMHLENGCICKILAYATMNMQIFFAYVNFVAYAGSFWPNYA